jgi:hypothetical protein
MKVLDLRCAHGHRFEGWFASEDDFRGQHARGLVECPVCADKAVERLPSAPRLNVANLREALPAKPPANAESEQQAKWLSAVREAIERTEDVGERFPEEARRIHYGEVEQRGIRGRASKQEADALRDEGIEVAPIPLPLLPKGPLQ